MKFLAESMLGRLARWLRILGYDTLYAREASLTTLKATLKREPRILLTRNTRRKPADFPFGLFFINHDRLDDQLREVLRELKLHPEEAKFFSRCAVCNGELESTTPLQVEGETPEYIFLRHEVFYRCVSCQRIYWPGSHLDRVRLKVQNVLFKNPEQPRPYKEHETE